MQPTIAPGNTSEPEYFVTKMESQCDHSKTKERAKAKMTKEKAKAKMAKEKAKEKAKKEKANPPHHDVDNHLQA